MNSLPRARTNRIKYTLVGIPNSVRTRYDALSGMDISTITLENENDAPAAGARLRAEGYWPSYEGNQITV